MGRDKRTFWELRALILYSLTRGQRTLNQLALDTGINWKTVDNHITYLLGRGYVTQVFFSNYVKIVEITSEGKEFLEALQKVPMEVLR